MILSRDVVGKKGMIDFNVDPWSLALLINPSEVRVAENNGL
jgi:hypothetical protein